jgi:MFS family permease
MAPADLPPKRGLFSALQRYPAYRKLWTGSVLAQIAQWMQSIALGWIALDLSDSAFFVGIVSFVAGIPFLVVGLPAGMLIDRFDRRRVLMMCQAVAAVVAVILSVMIISGWIEQWHLLIAAFLNGSILAIMTPAQQAITPSLVEREDLTNAIALTSAGFNVARILGPSLAGAVIAFAGVGPTFAIQALALCSALTIIGSAKFPSITRAVGLVNATSVLEGLRYVLRRPDLRVLFLLAFIPNFFAFPYIQFLNVFAVDVLDIGAAPLGVMMATSGVGALSGSLVIAGRGSVVRLGPMLFGFTIIYACAILLLSTVRTMPATIPLLYVGGFLGAMFMSQNNAAVQHRITDDVRGRVLGAYVLNQGLLPLGALPMGLIAGAFGVPVAMAIGASLTILATVALAIGTNPLWKEL